ncbi:MAG: hypothetical protein AABX88_03285 [Nanoarchaeota archaeon]|mgnify:CR=1 FL=1
MTKKVFTSLEEVEKEYSPNNYKKKYLECLAEKGEVDGLANYLVEHKINLFKIGLDKIMTPDNLSSLFGKIITINLNKKLMRKCSAG